MIRPVGEAGSSGMKAVAHWMTIKHTTGNKPQIWKQTSPKFLRDSHVKETRAKDWMAAGQLFIADPCPVWLEFAHCCSIPFTQACPHCFLPGSIPSRQSKAAASGHIPCYTQGTKLSFRPVIIKHVSRTVVFIPARIKAQT